MLRQLIKKFKLRLQAKSRLLAEVPADRYWLVLKLGLFAFFVPLLMRLPLARSTSFLVPSCLRKLKPSSLRCVAQQLQAVQPPVSDYMLYSTVAIRLGRPLTQDRCLTRCVTLYYFLSRQGLDLTIVFGAGSLNGQFAAHCWLEFDGKPFGEAEDPYLVYSPTYSIPDAVLAHPAVTGS